MPQTESFALVEESFAVYPDLTHTAPGEAAAAERLAQAVAAAAEQRELEVERRIQKTRANQAALWAHGPVLSEQLSTPAPKRAAAASSVDPEPTALPFR